MNIGIGLQYEYFSEKYDVAFSTLTFRYHAIKFPLFINNKLSKKISLNIKVAPSLYFPFVVDSNLTRLNLPNETESGKLGIYSALSMIFNRKKAINYGFTVFYNSILQNTTLLLDSDSIANQYTFSHVSIAFTYQIRLSK